MAVTDHQIRRQALAPPVAAGADAAQAATEPRFPYHYWLPQVEALRRQYQSAEPFPHIVLENFLEPRLARQMLAEFPPLSTEWIHWVHVNQRKYGTTDRNSLPPTIGSVIDEFNSPPFMGFLSRITGINDLLSDATLEGGGLHQSGPRAGRVSQRACRFHRASPSAEMASAHQSSSLPQPRLASVLRWRARAVGPHNATLRA
jgi:hypothetical protein